MEGADRFRSDSGRTRGGSGGVVTSPAEAMAVRKPSVLTAVPADGPEHLRAVAALPDALKGMYYCG